MSDFIILTDSSADLSGEMAQAADVQVLPLTFTIGGADYHNYPDNRELDPHAFYDALRTGGMSTKIQAAKIATSHGIPMAIINGSDPNLLYDLLDGIPVGSLFLPAKSIS